MTSYRLEVAGLDFLGHGHSTSVALGTLCYLRYLLLIPSAWFERHFAVAKKYVLKQRVDKWRDRGDANDEHRNQQQ